MKTVDVSTFAEWFGVTFDALVPMDTSWHRTINPANPTVREKAETTWLAQKKNERESFKPDVNSCRNFQVWWNNHWKRQNYFTVPAEYQHHRYELGQQQLHQLHWIWEWRVQQWHQSENGSRRLKLWNVGDDPYCQWRGLSTRRVSMAGNHPSDYPQTLFLSLFQYNLQPWHLIILTVSSGPHRPSSWMRNTVGSVEELSLTRTLSWLPPTAWMRHATSTSDWVKIF